MTAMDDALTRGEVVWTGAEVLADWRGHGVADIETPAIVDDFDRTVSNGWGPDYTQSGGSASEYSVSGGYGIMQPAVVAVVDRMYRGRVDTTGYDLSFIFATSALAVGAPQVVGVTAPAVDNNNGYWFFFNLNTNQTIQGVLQRFEGGTPTTVKTVTAAGLVHAINKEFAVRVQSIPSAAGKVNRAKIWDAALPEPTTWLYTAFDLIPGWIGRFAITSHLATSNTNTLPVSFKYRALRNRGIDNLDVGSVSVEMSLDDGMPSGVTNTAADGIPKLSADLLAPLDWDNPGAYYSPFRPDSPLYGLDRDVAAVTADIGLVTATGVQQVRAFTGQMSDLPTSGRSAGVNAITARRNQMRSLVQPHAVDGDMEGLDATHIVTSALHGCGIYASPPPRPGCKIWIPMHGSTATVIPNTASWDSEFNNGTYNYDYDFSTAVANPVRPTFIDGPFVGGLNASQNSRLQKNSILIEPNTPDFFTRRANAGRIEFWVKCDPFTPTLANDLVGVYISSGKENGAQYVRCGVDKDRKPYVEIIGSTATGHFDLLRPGTVLPTDGAWRFIGGAWDVAAGKLWLSIDGTISTDTTLTVLTTELADENELYDPQYTPGASNEGRAFGQIYTWLPMAELQCTSGSQANADTYPWINDTAYWDPASAGAVVRRSIHTLNVWDQTAPREAYELVVAMGVSELAWMGFDAADRFLYLTMPHWAETAQQTVSETLSTGTTVGNDLTPTRDPTKIFNSVSVKYRDKTAYGRAVFKRATIMQSSDVLVIAPGVNHFEFPTLSTIVAVEYLFNPWASRSGAVNYSRSSISANTASDGTGTYVIGGGAVTARFESWTPNSVMVKVTNTSATTYYMANNFDSFPFIEGRGTAVLTTEAYALARDEGSIAGRRGERGLDLDFPEIQRKDFAQFIAEELVGRLSLPRVTVTGTVFADPRRVPGNLVRIQDTEVSGINDLFRLVSVNTHVDGANVTQTFVAEQAWLVGVWDQFNWSQAIWGP
jgi:hypothetical protein